MSQIVILGAGLSGLSLAEALLDAGCRQPVVLIDRRRRWERDRTWCTWLTGPLRYADLATHRWYAWRVRRDGRDAVAHTRRHPYIRLESSAVYERALARLDAAPTMSLRCDERVLGIQQQAGRTTIQTTAGALEAGIVIDAMGPRSPLLRDHPAAATALSQRFVGWEVEVDRPVFDPGIVTLMDFRGCAGGALQFMYVLPFSSTAALIEHTTIGARGPSTAARRSMLEHELGDRLGVSHWRRTHEELGEIPMRSSGFEARPATGLLAVGAAAGAIRPSSGYAFTRTQRHVDAVAVALTSGVPLPDAVAPHRFQLLDQVFLTAISARADCGEQLLWQLAQRVPADAFARFMTDASGPRDEARVLAALPARPMLKAALSTIGPRQLHARQR